MKEGAAPAGQRFEATELTALAAAALTTAGLDGDKAKTVAEILVEGDLIGRVTHGLCLLGFYVSELESGGMATTGEPRVIADHGASLAWDGRWLPGPWLVCQGLDLAFGRVAEQGSVTVAIRHSHHAACMGAYLERATSRGLAVIIACSDASKALVTPHGGSRPVLTPNPIAAGWPTDGAPVLFDTSMSITSLGEARRAHDNGELFPGRWVVDDQGVPTDDPGALFADRPGALLPIGGVDHGHKGFALGLLVEMLTSGLAGGGRADRPARENHSIFMQVIDPAAFSGLAAFERETGWLADACRATPPAPWLAAAGEAGVRLPGEAALARRASALATGVPLSAQIVDDLSRLARRLEINPPSPID